MAQSVREQMEQAFMEACYNLRMQKVKQFELAEQLGLAPATLSGRMQDWTKFKVSEFVELCKIANVKL